MRFREAHDVRPRCQSIPTPALPAPHPNKWCPPSRPLPWKDALSPSDGRSPAVQGLGPFLWAAAACDEWAARLLDRTLGPAPGGREGFPAGLCVGLPPPPDQGLFNGHQQDAPLGGGLRSGGDRAAICLGAEAQTGEALLGRGGPRRGWSALRTKVRQRGEPSAGKLPTAAGLSRPTCSPEGAGLPRGGKAGGWGPAGGGPRTPRCVAGGQGFPPLGGVASGPPEPLCGCCLEASGPAEPVTEVGVFTEPCLPPRCFPTASACLLDGLIIAFHLFSFSSIKYVDGAALQNGHRGLDKSPALTQCSVRDAGAAPGAVGSVLRPGQP